MQTGMTWGQAGDANREKQTLPSENLGGHAPTFPSDLRDEHAPAWTPPQKIRALPIVDILFAALGIVGGAILLMMYVATGGWISTVTMGTLALFPLLAVVGLVQYLDRWEPETPLIKIVIFLWGAGVAALSAMIVNSVLDASLAAVTGDAAQAQVVTDRHQRRGALTWAATGGAESRRAMLLFLTDLATLGLEWTIVARTEDRQRERNDRFLLERVGASRRTFMELTSRARMVGTYGAR